MYQRTNYIFQKINVEKRFSSFSFSDMTFDEMNVGYCCKDEVLKIGNDFYLYKGENNYSTSNPETKSKILFKAGKKIVAEILA